MKLLTAAGGNMSLDSQVALLPYKSSSFATGGSVSLDFWAAVRPLQIQFAGVTLVSLEPGLRDLLYSYLQRHMARGRGQKVGPIDRGVRRSIYVFA